jgi:hypothetical protein
MSAGHGCRSPYYICAYNVYCAHQIQKPSPLYMWHIRGTTSSGVCYLLDDVRPSFIRRFSGACSLLFDVVLLALASGSLDVRCSVVLTAALIK